MYGDCKEETFGPYVNVGCSHTHADWTLLSILSSPVLLSSLQLSVKPSFLSLDKVESVQIITPPIFTRYEWIYKTIIC